MDRNTYIELLETLVKNRAVSADKEAVSKSTAIMQDFLSSNGIYCQTEVCSGYNVLYASTVPGKSADLVINAHLDVVPAMDEAQFTPVTKDGIMYARGVSDCLGSAVCIAKTLIDLKDSGKAVGAIFTCDEEIGGKTTKEMIRLGYGANSKIAIVIDADSYKITISQKGIVSIKLIARGKTGHSSQPWLFTNAIEVLIDAYGKLKKAWPEPDMNSDLYKYNSMAACQFHAGFAHNQIPDEATMVLNFRVTGDGDVEKVLDFVKDTTGLEVEIIETCPPVNCDENAPELQSLKREMESFFTGHEIKFTRMFGATDARHFSSMGIPIAILGLSGSGAHSANEKLPLDSMFETADFLTRYAQNNL